MNNTVGAQWMRTWLDAWESGVVDNVTALAADDIDFEDVALGHRAVGLNQFTRFVADSFELTRGATFELISFVASGDEYAAEWTMQPVGIRGCSKGRQRDGKVVYQRDYWNAAEAKS